MYDADPPKAPLEQHEQAEAAAKFSSCATVGPFVARRKKRLRVVSGSGSVIQKQVEGGSRKENAVEEDE